MRSVNNKLICEPFTGGKGLKTEVKNAFASVQQKNNLVGLKLLADAFIVTPSNNYTINAGSIVYFHEEVVHNHNNFHVPMPANAHIKVPFIVADFSQVILSCES